MSSFSILTTELHGRGYYSYFLQSKDFWKLVGFGADHPDTMWQGQQLNLDLSDFSPSSFSYATLPLRQEMKQFVESTLSEKFPTLSGGILWTCLGVVLLFLPLSLYVPKNTLIDNIIFFKDSIYFFKDLFIWERECTCAGTWGGRAEGENL